MRLPELKASKQKTLMTTTFKGYNHNDYITDGEMYDMKNLSSDSFPLLDQRQKRATVNLTEAGRLTGLYAHENLVTTKGTSVYYGGTLVEGITVGDYSSQPAKQIVSMGAYICIFPDQVYFNTKDLSDCGSMGVKYTNTCRVIYEMCRNDGRSYDYSQITNSDTAPSNPTNGQLWIDTSGEKHVLKEYNDVYLEWIEVATTFVKITIPSVNENYFSEVSVYDTLRVSMFLYDEHQTQAEQEEVMALQGDRIIYGVGSNYIIISGMISQRIDRNAYYYIWRIIPDMDYVCESKNRLWGCKYGIAYEDGQIKNEIRCSKLGDFKNWFSFAGLESDSYVVSVGSDGPFTGCVTQYGNPIFFKENIIHRISGTGPSTYSISSVGTKGIQEGSYRSAKVVNEVVYYKGVDDVMAFDGSMPYAISGALGKIKYSDARAGILNGKYYISMKDNNDEFSLFVYDTNLKLWHKEDNLEVIEFASLDGELYAINGLYGDNKLLMLTGTNPENLQYTLENDFTWSATFGLFGTDYTNQKYLSRFNIRMQIEDGASVKLEIQYDQDGVWHDQGTVKQRTTRTFMLPVIPRRCDHLQFRLTGTGRCRIYSISRVLEVGGDG